MRKGTILLIGIILLPLVGCLFMFFHPIKTYPPPETTEEFLKHIYGRDYVSHIMIPAREMEQYTEETLSVIITHIKSLVKYKFIDYRIINNTTEFISYRVFNNTAESTASPPFYLSSYGRQLSVLLGDVWYKVPASNIWGSSVSGNPAFLKPKKFRIYYDSDIPLTAGKTNSRLPTGHYRLELNAGDGWIILEFRLTDTKQRGEKKYILDIID